jgi:tyrosyl-tRNA synthetase
MIFDLVFLVVLIYAAYRGFSKGVVLQAATLLALILGIIGAIKFSGYTSALIIEHTKMTGEYLPIISFALTFIVIVVVVHLLAKVIERLVEAVALGFVNRLAGALFSMTKFAFIISVILVVLNGIHAKYSFLPEEKIDQSLMYRPLSKFAPGIFPYLHFDNPPRISGKGRRTFTGIATLFSIFSGTFVLKHPLTAEFLMLAVSHLPVNIIFAQISRFMDFIEELTWRGMIHDIMPGTEEQLKKEITTAYVGFDPTADSLHVGSFAQIILLKRFQLAGHKPIALVGGATGMIGDPSGKSQERNLLTEEMLQKNLDGIKAQLSKFLDFESDAPNKAEMVNNYDWMKDFSFLEFIRDVGKHITVNYMMAKDSVKKRVSGESGQGMSFAEFTYQLVQGYDFLHLNQEKNCKLQMGGSDQWGNIVTGTELIRRKTRNEAFALTIPLITKADGGKFGKTESGNVWLDPEKTTPYAFYQFWLNASDEDAANYMKVFTMLSRKEIEALVEEHKQAPHARALQKKLAEELTVMVHSRADFENAVEASQILFGKGTNESLAKLDEKTFLSVFEGVPTFELSHEIFSKGHTLVDLLTEEVAVFPSKGELRRLIKGGGLGINKQKIADGDTILDSSWLLNNKYILVQKGKKNYNLITIK